MEVKTDDQRDALLKALADAPTPILMQTVSLDGMITAFTGVGSGNEGTLRVTAEGRVAYR